MSFLVGLLLLVTLEETLESRSLTEFDGSKPIVGLFGEVIPTSFFTKPMTDVVANPSNYRGHLYLRNNPSGLPTNAILVNDCEYENAILISGVELKTGKSRNFLIKLNPYDDIVIDAPQFSRFSQVHALSLLPFRMYFDKALNQAKGTSSELLIEPPIAIESEAMSFGQGCDKYSGEARCTVQNTNGPGTGGTAVGYFRTGSWGPFGGGTYFQELYVDYPGNGIPYHDDQHLVTCQEGSTPEDRYITGSVTGRLIRWTQVGSVIISNQTGSAVCLVATFSEYPCDVDTNGNGIPDKPATWSVTKTQ